MKRERVFFSAGLLALCMGILIEQGQAMNEWKAVLAITNEASKRAAIKELQTRGVHPDYQKHYPPFVNTFTCLDGSRTDLKPTAVNDDYCDCVDGSDEPGTNACGNFKFYCSNAGHVPGVLASNRVNDGICDTDVCCDGQDEYSGLVVCPKLCAALVQETKRLKLERLNVQKQAGDGRYTVCNRASLANICVL